MKANVRQKDIVQCCVLGKGAAEASRSGTFAAANAKSQWINASGNSIVDALSILFNATKPVLKGTGGAVRAHLLGKN